jgi:hypothetical protein
MSALGQKRTLKRFHPMSALPPKADIRQGNREMPRRRSPCAHRFQHESAQEEMHRRVKQDRQ